MTARATLDHLLALRVLDSMGTALAPAVVAACRARGCAVPAAGELSGHGNWVNALTVLADGRLASGDGSGEVRVWDAVAGGRATAVLRVSDRVSALAAVFDGLAVGAGNYVEVWDVAGTSISKVETISVHSGVLALAVLADSRLAVGCDDGRVRVVDFDTSVMAAELRPSGRVAALAVLPNGTLASGSDDGTVRVWNVRRKMCVSLMNGYTAAMPVRSLAVLADGRLAGGSAGGSVLLWDVDSRTCVATLIRHSSFVTALVALPDGRLVSATQSGGVIQLWDTRPAAAAVMAASRHAASTVPTTVLAHMPNSTRGLVQLLDGRLACACTDTDEVFLLEVPPPAAYE